MKCVVCNETFNEASLSELLEHEHQSLDWLQLDSIGVHVGKTYDERESLNIAKIAFSETDNFLEVTYKDQRTYRYLDFPSDLFVAAIKSESIGRFLAEKVKGYYRYHYVGGGR